MENIGVICLTVLLCANLISGDVDHRIDRYPHDNGNGIVGMGGWGGGVVKRLVKRWTGLTSGNDADGKHDEKWGGGGYGGGGMVK